MTVFDTWHFFPRALNAVCRQKYTDWELLVMQDGPALDDPVRHALAEIDKAEFTNRIELFELPLAPLCFGNVGRREGLAQAQGDYVCWVNHDNLVTPQFLTEHVENVTRSPGCLSLVTIDYWKADSLRLNEYRRWNAHRYIGVMPKRLTPPGYGEVDLLCFAMPLTIAKEIDAFGEDHSTQYDADWRAFREASSLLDVETSTEIVGVHF